MTIERVFHCDGPECERHMRTTKAKPRMFLTVTRDIDPTMHFCGWDCALRYAAAREPTVYVPMHESPAGDD